MDEMNALFEEIKKRFATDEIEVKRKDLAKITLNRFHLFEAIDFLVDRHDYRTLNAIACADWIEEEHFAISGGQKTHLYGADDDPAWQCPHRLFDPPFQTGRDHGARPA